jgi:predicted nucleic acid-binding protein
VRVAPPVDRYSGRVLVDSSIWIEFFRKGSPELARLLDEDEVVLHPWVLGELALGNFRNRAEPLRLLGSLDRVHPPSDAEALQFIEARELYGSGLGWVDVHLLAAAVVHRLKLWTADRTLAGHAARLGVARGLAPGSA